MHCDGPWAGVVVQQGFNQSLRTEEYSAAFLLLMSVNCLTKRVTHPGIYLCQLHDHSICSRVLCTCSCHCVTATVSGLAFRLCRHFWNHDFPQRNLDALANGLSQNFSVNGRKSISCVQALLSCLYSCQYVSAIASGLMKELCSLSGIMLFVRGASMIPSMMMWATWMPCKKSCAPQCISPLLQNAL